LFSPAIILKTKKSNMATIRKRDGKKGVGYQVQVRIKGGDVETASPALWSQWKVQMPLIY